MQPNQNVSQARSSSVDRIFTIILFVVNSFFLYTSLASIVQFVLKQNALTIIGLVFAVIYTPLYVIGIRLWRKASKVGRPTIISQLVVVGSYILLYIIAAFLLI